MWLVTYTMYQELNWHYGIAGLFTTNFAAKRFLKTCDCANDIKYAVTGISVNKSKPISLSH
jgi:hypothetical protein